jgi:phospholipase/carboxylesterase
MIDLRTSLGGLSCRVLQQALPGARIELAVVLCHGFGAPGHDLVSLAPELCRARPELAQKVRFIFPEAPLALGAQGYGEGRAWWPLNLQRLAALQSGNASVARLRREVFEGLPRARRLVTGLIEELILQTQLPIGRVVLGGFSQGAMLATDVALRLEEAPAGLVILSGMLLNEVEWARRAPIRRGLHVLQAHGPPGSIASVFFRRGAPRSPGFLRPLGRVPGFRGRPHHSPRRRQAPRGFPRDHARPVRFFGLGEPGTRWLPSGQDPCS